MYPKIDAWQIDAMRREERARKIAAEERRRARVEIRETCAVCHGSGCEHCGMRGTREVR